MAAQDDHSTTAFYDPTWVMQHGGWIHANNVLFYFAQSPFFDRTSSNQSLITQNSGIPDREHLVLSTRQRFETALESIVGLQYVVAQDPLESNVMISGPNGPERSDIWVIRKQHRHGKGSGTDNMTVLGFYYIVNQIIYQAPSMANIMNYRMLNAILAVGKVFDAASPLPIFTASHGHTYFRPALKRANDTTTSGNLQSRESSPPVGGVTADTERQRDSAKTSSHDPTDERTLREALKMTRRFNKEYMDDMRLSGEPGTLRIARKNEGQSSLKVGEVGLKVAASKGVQMSTSRTSSSKTSPTDASKATTSQAAASAPTASDMTTSGGGRR